MTTTTHINRRAATVLTAALALGTAAPAAAQPIGSDGPVPVAPPMHAQQYDRANVLPSHMKAFPEMTAAPVATATPRAAVSHSTPAGSSDAAYIVVGGVLIALGGLGGTLAAANRRRTAPARPRAAA
jgi:hypothetical protein